MAANTDLAEEIIRKGRLFAQNAKYGKPSWMNAKVDTKSAASVPAGSNDHDTVDNKENVNTCTASAGSPVVQQAACVPSKSGESSAALTTTAGPCTGSNDITVLPSLAARIENLEHAVYFKSWGKPAERTGPAAGKRKVIIQGDPAWNSSPKPDFIASLVFGGPLESIRCLSNLAVVTFINPEDAQAYYEATPNGIVFRKSAETLEYAEIRLDNEVTPNSSLVQQYLDNGVTRCVRAIGIDIAISLQDLHTLGNGPVNSRGQLPRKLERLTDDLNKSGHRVNTFRFCDIRHAFAFKTEVSHMIEYEEVNFQYAVDPCAEADGPRVEIRPITRVF